MSIHSLNADLGLCRLHKQSYQVPLKWRQLWAEGHYRVLLNVTTRNQLQNKSVFCLKRKRNPWPSDAGGAAAPRRTPPGPQHLAMPRPPHHRAESERSRSPPPLSRASGKEPRGVAAASSASRCPTLALRRLPAGRGALRDVAAPRLGPQRPRAECTAGPPPTSGPGRCAQAREASTRVRAPSGGQHA